MNEFNINNRDYWLVNLCGVNILAYVEIDKKPVILILFTSINQ